MQRREIRLNLENMLFAVDNHLGVDVEIAMPKRRGILVLILEPDGNAKFCWYDFLDCLQKILGSLIFERKPACVRQLRGVPFKVFLHLFACARF